MVEQIIQQRLSLLAPEYKELILDEHVEATTTIFADQYNFTDTQRTVFENALYLFFLFLLNREELIAFVRDEVDLEEAVANNIVSIVIDQLPQTFKEELDQVRISLNKQTDSLESEIAETKAVLDTIPQVRTMRSDQQHAQEAEVVHASSQDDILPQKPSTAPRWSSENT